MPKTVYQYDDNGYFLYETVADESPLEPGVYLYPRNTTEKKPPLGDTGQTAKFDGEDWNLVESEQPTILDRLTDFFSENPDIWHLINSRLDNK